MHTSPLNYLNTIRIMNACNLLRNTNHTILNISVMTGFSTLSNFNRHFNEMMKAVSYTHLRAHETRHDLVCRLLLEKKKKKKKGKKVKR